jgi:hypothetical protein
MSFEKHLPDCFFLLFTNRHYKVYIVKGKVRCNYYYYFFITFSMTQKSRHFLMHWMSVKLSDHFQIREHSWPCLFHINYLPIQLHQHKRISPYVWLVVSKSGNPGPVPKTRAQIRIFLISSLFKALILIKFEHNA